MEESVLHLYETLVQLLFHFGRVDNTLSNLGLIEGSLDALLNVLAKASLNELRNFFTKHSVPIRYCEEMSSSIFTQVR